MEAVTGLHACTGNIMQCKWYWTCHFVLPLSNDDFKFHDGCPIRALAIPFSLSIMVMVLPYDVLCHAMCESILKPTDIVACLTVCRLWYDTAIYRLLATITFDARLGCTFWLAYFQRHPELQALVWELHLDSHGDPFRFTSQDVNRMLSLCTAMIHFVVCDISLSKFRTPVYFHWVVDIKLVSCFVLTMGTTNLLTHSSINSVTLMRPRFFQNQADVVGPQVYGPPRLLTVPCDMSFNSERYRPCLPMSPYSLYCSGKIGTRHYPK